MYRFSSVLQKPNRNFTLTPTACAVPNLLTLEEGPAAGEEVGVMEDPAGNGMAKASGVWLKSSRQMGD